MRARTPVVSVAALLDLLAELEDGGLRARRVCVFLWAAARGGRLEDAEPGPVRRVLERIYWRAFHSPRVDELDVARRLRRALRRELREASPALRELVRASARIVEGGARRASSPKQGK